MSNTTAANPSIGTYNLDDLALLLKASSRHVRRLAESGKLPPSLKIGRILRWSKAVVDKWLASGGATASEIELAGEPEEVKQSPADFIDRHPSYPFPIINAWEELDELPADAWFTHNGCEFARIVGTNDCDGLVRLEFFLRERGQEDVEGDPRWINLRSLMRRYAWTMDVRPSHRILHRCGTGRPPAWTEQHNPDWWKGAEKRGQTGSYV